LTRQQKISHQISKIEAQEKTVLEQNNQIEKLSTQLEKAYHKVQNIALKSIEGSRTSRVLNSIEKMLADQARSDVKG
jgi:uncharacterized coiled-coil protein SlyX